MSEIEKFIQRVEKSNRARSKDVRMNLTEAQSLVNELAILLKKENQLLDVINTLREQRGPSEGPKYELHMDGGSFKS